MPQRPPEGLGTGPTAPHLHSSPPWPCPPTPQTPRTGNSRNSSTSTSSRGCGWGQPGGLRHGWTSRGAGLPPAARRAGDTEASSAPGRAAAHTPSPRLPWVGNPRLPPPSSPPPAPFPQGGQRQGRRWCTCFSVSCGAGMGGGRWPGSVVLAPGPSPQPGGLGREWRFSLRTGGRSLYSCPGRGPESLSLLPRPRGPAALPPTPFRLLFRPGRHQRREPGQSW